MVYPQGRFSGPTRWDQVWHGKPLALCRSVLAGPCLTTVVRTRGPAWSWPGIRQTKCPIVFETTSRLEELECMFLLGGGVGMGLVVT